MAKPNWQRTLQEVLGHKTTTVSAVSEKSGNEYKIDVISILEVVSVGSYEEADGKFKYSIVDTKNNLEYTIKTSNKVDISFGTVLRFTNVRGGTLNNGNGWYAADSVQVVEK